MQIKLRDQGDVYAMFLKKYSTFAILKGISDELVPYPVSAMSRYEPSGKDEKQITELRKWHHGDKLKGWCGCRCVSLNKHNMPFLIPTSLDSLFLIHLSSLCCGFLLTVLSCETF